MEIIAYAVGGFFACGWAKGKSWERKALVGLIFPAHFAAVELFPAAFAKAYEQGVKIANKPPPPLPPPPAPVAPTRTELLWKIRREFEQNLAVIESAPLGEAERNAGRDRVTQKFIERLEELL